MSKIWITTWTTHFMIALQSHCAFSQGSGTQNDSCTHWTQQTVRKMVFLVWMEKTWIDRCHQFPYPFRRKTDDHVFSITDASVPPAAETVRPALCPSAASWLGTASWLLKEHVLPLSGDKPPSLWMWKSYLPIILKTDLVFLFSCCFLLVLMLLMTFFALFCFSPTSQISCKTIENLLFTKCRSTHQNYRHQHRYGVNHFQAIG